MTITTLHKCGNCNRPMRPYDTLLSDYPGTVNMRNKNICGNCHAEQLRNQYHSARQRMEQRNRDRLAHIESLPTVEERMEYVAPGVHKYLHNRKLRGIPETGLRVSGRR